LSKFALLSIILLLLCSYSSLAQEQKPADSLDPARVFITDSQSWSVGGSSGGSPGAFGGAMAGGARPQTAEIIKTFGERCPQVKVNNIQNKADYIVLLDHEGGKGLLQHKNKVAVFARVSGDSIVSKSTVSLGSSVQDACEAILADWSSHGAAIRAASAPAPIQPVMSTTVATPAAPTSATAPQMGKLSVSSTPDGADIEIDGSFVGNTPSDMQVSEGEHSVSVKKSGFTAWDRKLKINAGSNVHLNAELQKGSQ
jgi:hypothetical protein